MLGFSTISGAPVSDTGETASAVTPLDRLSDLYTQRPGMVDRIGRPLLLGNGIFDDYVDARTMIASLSFISEGIGTASCFSASTATLGFGSQSIGQVDLQVISAAVVTADAMSFAQSNLNASALATVTWAGIAST